MRRRVRIATRGSQLAVAQSQWVAEQIRQARPEWSVELVTIRTSGDRFADRPLAALGGKGLFVKEIEEALLRGEVECAVHSAKDLPASLQKSLVIAAVPKREAVEDVLVTRHGIPLEDLPSGYKLGTSSPRRSALLRWLRPDVQVVPLRGNVETRLGKLTRGDVDGVLLAAAGLRRLGMWSAQFVGLDPTLVLPAVGQGALVVETRADRWAEHLQFLHDPLSGCMLDAERAFLAAMGGSCHTSLGAYSVIDQATLTLHGLVADPSGRQIVRGVCRGSTADPVSVGKALAEQLLGCGGARLLEGDGSGTL